MLSHPTRQHKLLQPTWLKILITILIVFGIYFRVVNLDQKVYWHDEAWTSLRASGYTAKEVNQAIFNGQVIRVEDLQPYQQLNRNRDLVDTVQALAQEDAQHPPLYYVLVRLWMRLFGSSVTAMRSLSVLFGLLAFPCLYWLSRELFQSPAIAGVAVALLAISPFHVLYAQEAREYSLWTVMILVSSAMLLRAVRQKSSRAFGLYAITLALSFYTHPLSALVSIGHGVYVIVTERFRPTKVLVAYLLASLGALLVFAPWLTLAIASWSKTGGWTTVPISLPSLLKTWGLHINRAFILTIGDFGFDNLLTYLTLPIFIAIFGYSIYVLCRHTPLRVWFFVLTLIGIPTLALALPDLILGGQRSVASRYLVPFYLGILLAIAHLLARQITSASSGRRSVTRVVLAIVVCAGMISCGVSAQAETTWNKAINYNLNHVAAIINQSQTPLLISNSFGINFGTILALSHRLDGEVHLQLVNGWTEPDFNNVPKIPQRFDNIFVLGPSEQFREKLEQEYNAQLNLTFHDSHLWLWQMAR